MKFTVIDEFAAGFFRFEGVDPGLAVLTFNDGVRILFEPDELLFDIL